MATSRWQVHRVLKAGGRFAIATSVVLRPLEDGVWPLCMRMFSNLDDLVPAAAAASLEALAVDTSRRRRV